MRTSIHGLGVTIDVDPGELSAGEFKIAWSRCLVVPGPDRPTPTTRVVVGPRPTMTSLTQAITYELIIQRRGELLMLHAGAVSHPETGRSIAYVAPGGMGKTTLTRILGQRFGYLTDETVGLDPVTRWITPYPKPLSLRTREGGFPKREEGPDGLGLLPAHPAPVLTSLILIRRDPAVTGPRWTRLDLFDAMVSLVPETSSLSRLQRPLHVLRDLYAALDGVWLVDYAEATDLVDPISERLEA